MSCCGSRRSRERTRAAVVTTPEGPGPPARLATVRVRSLREGELRVTGAESRCAYRFAAGGAAQPVYRIDLPQLLRGGLVERA